MTIYIYDNGDGTITFKFWTSEFVATEKAFNNYFEGSPMCNKEDVFEVMEEIDSWYMDNFNEGCVRFEFG